MRIEEQENNNPFGMKISDPELIRKISEGGLESLSPDDINSIGIEVKAGQMYMGDASQANLEDANRFKFRAAENGQTGPLPLRKGLVGYFVILLVVFIVLSIIGIICSKMFLPSLTYKDMIGLSFTLVVGLGLCLSEFRTAFVAKKYMTERVQGKCISHEHASGSGKLNQRRSIYEYTYKGQVYRSHEKVYANRGYAKVGEVRELLITPENPRCIYDPKAGNARKLGMIGIGMIFIGIVVVVVISVCING
jgi:hypothetical protein